MEVQLPDVASDGISAVQFSPLMSHVNVLMVSSWDKTIRLFDTATPCMKSMQSHATPILDCCFSSSTQMGYAATVAGEVVQVNWETGQQTGVGKHTAPVRNVVYNANQGMLYSGSWDGNVKAWDERQNKTAMTLEQEGKVFAMDVRGNTLAVTTSKRQINIYDVRQLESPRESRESPLKYQSRNLKLFLDESGFCVSSTEGRVAVEYFDLPTMPAKKGYSFKCHRQKENGETFVFPVNALAFHPFGTFASGGCDGVVSIWDGASKKRTCQFRKYPTSISALDFSCDGRHVAIASSYTFEEGQKDHPADSVFIRQIQDSEVLPK